MNWKCETTSQNNLEKYNDPQYYDLEYQSYLEDVPLLAEWSDRQQGTIIDLACGTGRVTIPLAKLGHKLIGIDLHEGMLNQAKEKTMNTSLSVEWILQDCTKFFLPLTANLIYMTGNSFQHFLSNDSQNQLLESVSKHLDSSGIFIFNTRFPILSELAEVEQTTKVYIDKRNRKIREHTKEYYDSLTQILHCTSLREILDGTEVKKFEEDSISLRFVFPLEMERLLTQNGFIILESYSSWRKSPLSNDSSEMIFICRKG